MRKYTYISLTLLIILFASCQTLKSGKPIINTQHLATMTEYEKFDIKPYEDKIDPLRKRMSYRYTREDGTKISVLWREGFGAQVNETPPMPYFYRVKKSFYADGSLREKGAYISSFIGGRIGQWLECDKDGECKVVDYEENRGKFGYEDVLKFLEKKKQINLKNGKGRESVNISYSYENTCWTVVILLPGTFIRIEYTLDGNTGKILNEVETVDEV